jgi:pimeloyl-ACP methyl ester carboxylesterase
VDGTLRTRDGRALSYEQHGDPGGKPVIVMHGTPGSRRAPVPRASRLYPLGVRLIAYDRPGYGGSDRLAGRSVAHAAEDVVDLADWLGIEKFGVVGRSGGAPHALACAALLPERVTRAAALVSFAPYTLMGRDWYNGMTDSNRREFSMAELGVEKLAALLTDAAKDMLGDPESRLPFDEGDLTRGDRAMMADFGIRGMLVRGFAEAVRDSPYGWIDDALSFVRPWGFDPQDIIVPVQLWHGDADIYAPVSHTHWLGGRIATSTTVIERGAGHFDSIAALPSVLNWLST